MTNEERILLEDELSNLEALEDDPDLMTEADVKRLKEIRGLLAQKARSIFTTITIENEPLEDLAFHQAVEEFKEWCKNNEDDGESFFDSLYSFKVILKEKTIQYANFGEKTYLYTFDILED